MEFSVTKNADVFFLNKLLGINNDVIIDVDTANVVVNFGIEIEFREWGIKDISVSMHKVTGNIHWEIQPDELNAADIAEITAAGGIEMRSGVYCGNTEVDTNNGWKIEDDISIAGTQIAVDEVEIDCAKKVITVYIK